MTVPDLLTDQPRRPNFILPLCEKHFSQERVQGFLDPFILGATRVLLIP